jgi:hypothetical protein
MGEKKRASREEKHPFVRGRFEPGTRGGMTPDETCDVCDRDPRDVVHQVGPDLAEQFRAHRDAAMAENEVRLDGQFDAAVARFPDELRAAWPEAAAVPKDDLGWREVSVGHSAGGALCELVWEVGNDAVGRRAFRLAWSSDARDWRWSPVTYTRERGYVADGE